MNLKAYWPYLAAAIGLLALVWMVQKYMDKKRISNAVDTSRKQTDQAAESFDAAPFATALYQELVENWTCNPKIYQDVLALSDEKIRKVWAEYESKYRSHKGSLRQAISQSSYFGWEWLLMNGCASVANNLVRKLDQLNLA